MFRALLAGIIGVIIGCAITFVVSLVNQPPWELGGILVAVGMASFFGPFCTALGTMNKQSSGNAAPPR
jgi:presenilin-like A22 family membrane protease